MRCRHLLPLFTLFSLIAAHSMHLRRDPTPEELAREEVHARERTIMARNCEPEIREHVTMRMRRRAEIQKRKAEAQGSSSHVARAHYPNIQNKTCVIAPEAAEGPYYVNNELVRQDISEAQPGVRLLMDFGVLNTSSCTPMNYSFVEIWHANATGDLSAYNSATFNSTETWLRGGWYTDSNGTVEITTVYPGYYSGRAPHIQMMVHKNWTQSDNGTLVSHSGTLVHIGKAFFIEDWNDLVYQTSPYSSNTNQRTLNSEDPTFAPSFQNGYSALADLQFLNGNDLSGGLVGYITLGVNPRSTYTISNTNYNGDSSGSLNGGTGDNPYPNASPNASAAGPQGWGNTLYLSFLMFAFFGYRYTPNLIRGQGSSFL